MEDHLQQEIVNYMGFPVGTFPIRYLGVPLISTKLKALDCHALEDRILGRIKTWTNRFLSYAGRLQLIQSVIFSIQSFWSAHFILPAKVTKSIEGILSAFLWNGVSLKKHGAKVAWADISKPKEEGGLGIKKVKDWNMAAMTRYIWLICQPNSNSLWATWVKKNLLHKEQFWVAKVPWNCSWTWRKILKLRERVKHFISVRIGNGTSTSLWFDSWRPQGPICSSTQARVIYDSGLTKEAKVCAIISQGNWRWPPPNSNDLIILKEEAITLPPPICSQHDKVLWNGSNDFSIKGAWTVLRSHSPRVDWAHLVWFKHYVPRHSFILWLAMRGRLSTQDRLLSFGLVQQMRCYFCEDNIEDHNHLFFNCSYTFRIWSTIASKCDLLSFPSNWETLKPWCCNMIKGTSLIATIRKLALGAAIYFIWIERNSRKYRSSPQNEQGMIAKIVDSVKMKLDGAIFPRSSANLHVTSVWKLPSSILRS